MSESPTRIGTLDDDEDPSLAPIRDEEQTTGLQNLLSTLESALTADVTWEPITLPILKRPGVSVRFSTELDEDTINTIRKRAQDKKSVDGVNNLRFCSMILARQCEAILMNGVEVTGEEGEPLTFGHARIRQLFGNSASIRAADAAVKAFGSDPHVMLAANEVMDAAGFGDEMVPVEGEDPTNAS